MKQTLFILALTVSFLQSHAQKIRFTDTTNKWNWQWNSWGMCYLVSNFYEGDTVINNITYKKLFGAGFIREDTLSQAVYIILQNSYHHDTFERVLYDYNLQVGDTFTQKHTYYKFDFVVTGIDSTLINNTWHRIWKFQSTSHTNTSTIEYEVIEGIGCTITPWFPAYPRTHENVLRLMCYKNGSTQPPLNPPAAGGFFDNIVSCTLNVKDFNQTPDGTSIYPHPANKSSKMVLNKEFSGILSIYNSVGQIIKCYQFSSSNELTIGELPASGIYFYQITNNDERYTRRGKFAYE